MKNYLSLVKFSHTVFALPFAMIGFTLGLYCFDYLNEHTSKYFIFWDLYKIGSVWLYVALTGPICYLMLKPYY